MKQAIKDKILNLQSLEKQVSNLRQEILNVLEADCDKYKGKLVKIVGQKGWNTGILDSVRFSITGNKVTKYANVSYGKKVSRYIPFEDIEFLSEQEDKDFKLHSSIK